MSHLRLIEGWAQAAEPAQFSAFDVPVDPPADDDALVAELAQELEPGVAEPSDPGN
jgi:hypothetical protein